MNGTILAHTDGNDGNVPNLMVKIPEQNEFYLGELFYFFSSRVRLQCQRIYPGRESI